MGDVTFLCARNLFVDWLRKGRFQFGEFCTLKGILLFLFVSSFFFQRQQSICRP